MSVTQRLPVVGEDTVQIAAVHLQCYTVIADEHSLRCQTRHFEKNSGISMEGT